MEAGGRSAVFHVTVEEQVEAPLSMVQEVADKVPDANEETESTVTLTSVLEDKEPLVPVIIM